MAVLEIFLALFVLAAHAHPASSPQSRNTRSDDVATLSLLPQATGGFDLAVVRDGVRKVIGRLGTNLLTSYTMEDIEDGVEVHIGGANLTVQILQDTQRSRRVTGYRIKWVADPGLILKDIYKFDDHHWYGGRTKINQQYPLEKIIQSSSPYYSSSEDNSAIAERYWLNSDGQYFYVFPEAPLFVDYNSELSGQLVLKSQIAAPYSSKRDLIIYEYHIWSADNVKEAHKHAVENYLGKPSGVPDFRMVQHPIWSTWAQYSRDINEEKVLALANQITANGFNNSHLEINDHWETCYGSLTVDTQKFPDFGKTVQDLKTLGYRVTLWIHTFINRDCEPFYSQALQNGYLVLNEDGSPETNWWNDNGAPAGYIDFTNTNAAEWFASRVRTLMLEYNIDSFKFDAGESSFSPEIAVQTGSIDRQPHTIVERYVRTVASFGNMVEVRTAFMTQDLPIFVRMLNRYSIWGADNGLSSVLTTTFQMNLAGYPLMLPAPIGGNGYSLNGPPANRPTKELFIRWVQANTFLPAMQYSFAPWNFDEETVTISKKYTELHATYAQQIYAAMRAAVESGTPVNPPLWWLDPTDENCLVIADEYLLGENIIVAPVLAAGATARDIYLPVGTWLEEGDTQREHVGPTWLRNHPAPLDYLPYFVKLDTSETEVENSDEDSGGDDTGGGDGTGDGEDGAHDSATVPNVAALLVLSGLLANMFNAL